MAGWRGDGGGGAGRPAEGVELQQPGQGQMMNCYQWNLSWHDDYYQWHLMIAKIPAVIVG